MAVFVGPLTSTRFPYKSGRFTSDPCHVSRKQNRITCLVVDEVVDFFQRSSVQFRRERFIFRRKPRPILDTQFPSRLEAVFAHQLHCLPFESFQRLFGKRFHLSFDFLAGHRYRFRRIRVSFGGIEPGHVRLVFRFVFWTARVRYRSTRFNRKFALFLTVFVGVRTETDRRILWEIRRQGQGNVGCGSRRCRIRDTFWTRHFILLGTSGGLAARNAIRHPERLTGNWSPAPATALRRRQHSGGSQYFYLRRSILK